jgi:hypothetical protein
MNPRTRRLRRHRRKARKFIDELLRKGYPRLKIAAELETKFPIYTSRVHATFEE